MTTTKSMGAMAVVEAGNAENTPPILGTSQAHPAQTGTGQGRDGRAQDERSRAVFIITPRLLGVEEAAGYLGVGADVVKGLLESGTLRPVAVPRPQTMRELARSRKRAAKAKTKTAFKHHIRRTLFDVRDLDRLVDGWKADQ